MKARHNTDAGVLDSLMQAADAAWARYDYQAGIETMKQARRLAPSHPEVLLRLGRMLGLRYEFTAARDYFEQALQAAPQPVEMLRIILVICQSFSNLDISRHFLQLAVARPDVGPDLVVALAQICELGHQPAEAAELIERALKVNPNLLAAVLIKARLERQAGRLEQAESMLRPFLREPYANTWMHVQAWYELATLLDRQEQYDDAMTAIFTAKKLQQVQARQLVYDDSQFRTVCQAMASDEFGTQLQQWLANGPALAPTRRLAVMVGYARSGTTLLEQVLDAHPEVIAAEETHIFVEEAFKPLWRGLAPGLDMPAVLKAVGNPSLLKSRTAYFQIMEKFFRQPIAGRLVLDKNPALNYLVPAFVRIFPEVKFLVALRDPRDVILSRYMQTLQVAPHTKKFVSLEETVNDYVLLMNLWQTLAPHLPGRFLEVRYEDLVTDLASVACRTIQFLELPWDDRVLQFHEHAREKTVRTPNTLEVTQPVYQRACGRWRNYQKYLEPHFQKLEPFVAAFGYEWKNKS